MSNTSQRAGWPNELSAAMTGSAVLVGTLLHNPVIMYFDNQSTANVAISVNDPTGANVWKTFTAGEVLSIDMRSNHGIAANFTADLGTNFYGNGTNASGNFKISYLSALSPTGG
jgi:hypothetical protein